MKSREFLESYTYPARMELNDLNCIHWAQDRGRLNERILSLEKLLVETKRQLNKLM